MTRYSVPDDEILETGVRFTVAELNRMADDEMRGITPPPLSYNEAVLLAALVRQRFEQQLHALADAEATRLHDALGLPDHVSVVFDKGTGA